jgi:asparagine synthase (glutamine-hydrolysing)
LKETFSDVLPPGLTKRRKQGFDLPVGEWLKKEMSELFWDTVLSSATNDGILNLQSLESLWSEHCKGRADYTKLLWAVFVYCWWNKTKG